VIDIIETLDTYDIAGILDRDDQAGRKVSGYMIIGTDERIPELIHEGHHFLVSSGQISRSYLRTNLYGTIVQAGGVMATIVSPKAYIARYVQFGGGVSVGHGAVVNSGASIADNCIVNTGAIVEHDACVSAHCHIATGAIVNGGASIGERTLIGSRAVILQGVSIGAGCVIGAGAVVLRDVADGQTMGGVPARTLRP
jgi:sugar O-acyltransferase (sialic acid O-acetyltransferase NeuD family)